MGWRVNTKPRSLYPWERAGAHYTGEFVGPRAGLDGCGKSRFNRDSIPGLPSPYRVAVPTELPRKLELLNKRNENFRKKTVESTLRSN